MYKPYRGGRSNGKKIGGKKFGGKKPWDRSFNDRDGGRPTMHEATCGECGKICEVPFKPNGHRPVFCSNCFKKDGDSEPRTFSRGPKERFGSAPSAGNKDLEDVKRQLKLVNEKLDTIIEAINAEE